jgi:hypothetical protein
MSSALACAYDSGFWFSPLCGELPRRVESTAAFLSIIVLGALEIESEIDKSAIAQGVDLGAMSVVLGRETSADIRSRKEKT